MPMNCHSPIVYPFSNHIKNGIKKTLICLQAVIMLSEKNITNTASHSWIGIFFCQGHFNQVSTTKCDISVSRLLGFDTFSNFWGFGKFGLSFRQFCLGFGIFLKTKVSVSFLKSFVSEMFPYWSWKKSWVQFTGSIRRVVCDDFPNKRTI